MEEQVTGLTLVVPTLNGEGRIARCIESLNEMLDGSSPLVDVMVVDNGSDDATASVVQSAIGRRTDGRLKYELEPQRGLNFARNCGVLSTSAELVGFVDDDETVKSDFADIAISVLRERPFLAGVGGHYVEPPGERRRTCKRCSLGAVKPHISADGTSNRLLGGNMVIRRSAFDSVGLFDESLSGRGDEAEWFHRAGEHGLTFGYEPRLTVVHHRDHLGAVDIVRVQYRQGRALPRATQLMGRDYRPRPARVLRGIAHAVRHRCMMGVVNASRESGAIIAWARRDVG